MRAHKPVDLRQHPYVRDVCIIRANAKLVPVRVRDVPADVASVCAREVRWCTRPATPRLLETESWPRWIHSSLRIGPIHMPCAQSCVPTSFQTGVWTCAIEHWASIPWALIP